VNTRTKLFRTTDFFVAASIRSLEKVIRCCTGRKAKCRSQRLGIDAVGFDQKSQLIHLATIRWEGVLNHSCQQLGGSGCPEFGEIGF